MCAQKLMAIVGLIYRKSRKN